MGSTPMLLTIAGLTVLSLAVPAIGKAVAGFLINVVEGPALTLVSYAAEFFGRLINAIAGVLFWVSNTTVVFAIRLNSLLANPNLVKESVIGEGFRITLAVANVGLVLSIVVIAFMVMFRVKGAKTMLIKFVFAALLINFSFFITTSLIIKPANEITSALYEAANVNIDTFRQAFKPSDVDIETALRIQLATTPEQAAFLALEPEIYNVVYEQLIWLETQAFGGIDGVTSEVRNAVATIITNEVFLKEYFGKLAIDLALGNEVGDQELREIIWRIGIDEPSIAQPYDTYFELDGNPPDNDPTYTEFADRIIDGVQAEIDNGVVLVEGESPIDLPDCNISNPQASCSDEFLALATTLLVSSNSLAEIAIKIGAILFYATFVFLGAFALFATGIMFIIRYIALGFLIILAPIVWIGFIFPQLKAGAKQNIWQAWWKNFTKWVIFGPVAMFFFFLAARAASTLDSNVPIPSPEGGALLAIAAAFGEMIFIVGLLIGGLLISNKLSITGSQWTYGGAKGAITGFYKGVGKWVGTTAVVRPATSTAGVVLRTAGAAARGVGALRHRIPTRRGPGRPPPGGPPAGPGGGTPPREGRGGRGIIHPLQPVGALAHATGNTLTRMAEKLERAGGVRPPTGGPIRLIQRIRNARREQGVVNQTRNNLEMTMQGMGLSNQQIQRIARRVQRALRRGADLPTTTTIVQQNGVSDVAQAQMIADIMGRLDTREEEIRDMTRNMWRSNVLNPAREYRNLPNPLREAWDGARKGTKAKKKKKDDDENE